MKRSLLAVTAVMAFGSLAFANGPVDIGKDRKDRLENAGQVMKEIVNVPDNQGSITSS